MKLYARPASPFARKVRVMIIETGLAETIEIEMLASVEEVQNMPPARNPLGKIPALELDNGEAIFDSPVICEYLDSLHDGDKLFPASGNARWRALNMQALGDGMSDAGVYWLIETRRPEDLQYDKWIKRQTATIFRAMDALEAVTDELEAGFGIGQISVASSLGWLDFRFSDLDWRNQRPGLADWFEEISDRPSMTQTVPKEG